MAKSSNTSDMAKFLARVDKLEEERKAMVDNANQALTRYDALHKLSIPNDVSPPFHFSSRPCYAASERVRPAAVLLSFPMGRASRHVGCLTSSMDHHSSYSAPTVSRLQPLR